MRWVFATLSDKGGGFITKMVTANDFFWGGIFFWMQIFVLGSPEEWLLDTPFKKQGLFFCLFFF